MSEIEKLIGAAESMTPDEIHQHPMAAVDKLRALARELRAARAGVVAEEPEWEYGFTSKWGSFAAHDQTSAEQQAATIRIEIEAGRSSGDLRYHGRVVRRRPAGKAGPWVPIEQGDIDA